MTKEKTNISEEIREELSKTSELILYNDDVNTFDFVINTLVEVCHHDPITAEQCTLIAHYNGQCVVKSGDYEELEPMAKEMTRRGLTVKVV